MIIIRLKLVNFTTSLLAQTVNGPGDWVHNVQQATACPSLICTGTCVIMAGRPAAQCPTGHCVTGHPGTQRSTAHCVAGTRVHIVHYKNPRGLKRSCRIIQAGRVHNNVLVTSGVRDSPIIFPSFQNLSLDSLGTGPMVIVKAEVVDHSSQSVARNMFHGTQKYIKL